MVVVYASHLDGYDGWETVRPTTWRSTKVMLAFVGVDELAVKGTDGMPNEQEMCGDAQLAGDEQRCQAGRKEPARSTYLCGPPHRASITNSFLSRKSPFRSRPGIQVPRGCERSGCDGVLGGRGT